MNRLNRASIASQAGRRVLVGLVLLFAASLSHAFLVRVDARTDGNLKPRVVGISTLPAGTQLLVTIERRDIKYMAQDKVVVRDGGAFESTAFTDKTRDLMPGKYGVELSMPLPSVQSNAVRSQIGSKGEKLEGPLVKSVFGEKVVEKRFSFSIAGGSNPSDIAKRKAESERDLKEWKAQSCVDICKFVKAYADKKGEPYDQLACLAKCPKK